MKQIKLLLAFICLAASLRAQTGQQLHWVPPMHVHDAAPDSRNVDALRVIFDVSPVSSTDSLFAVWEEKISANTTRIVMRNMEVYNHYTEFYKTGVIYRRPRLLDIRENTSGRETLFYLFYETNQNGNWDIYYMKYFGLGEFSEPIPVVKTSADEQNFSLGTYRIAWESEGKIATSVLDQNFNWEQPVTIESGNCSYPLVGYWDQTVYFLKAMNDSVSIHYSALNGTSWEPSKVLFSSGINSSLSMNKGYNGREMLSWQNNNAGESSIYICDLSTSPATVFRYGLFPGFNKFKPTIFESRIVIGKAPELPIIAFEMDENGMQHIYASKSPECLDTFIIVSNPNFPCFNPKLFEGVLREGTLLNKYIFWEEYINGRMKLVFRSSGYTVTAQKDRFPIKPEKLELYQNYPNPFNPSTTIEFTVAAAGRVTLRLYDIRGKEVALIFDGEKPAGRHRIIFNAQSSREGGKMELASGVYYYQLASEDQTITRKMLLIK